MRISKRPFRITLVAWLVLISTALNLVRVATSLTWGEAIQSYAPQPGALYIGMTGGLWAILGLLILWALWGRKPWALRALLGGAWLYAAWSWTDRLVFESTSTANWRFALLVTVLLLGFITGLGLDQRSREYLRKEAHERQSED